MTESWTTQDNLDRLKIWRGVFEDAVRTGDYTDSRLNPQTVATERLARAINRLCDLMEKPK